MQKRSSDAYRKRSSVAIIDETLGTPWKIISLLLGAVFMLRGIAVLFFCDQGETGFFGWAPVMEIIKDCKTNPYQALISSLMALQFFLVATIRINMALAKHVADMYNSLCLLVVADAFYVMTMIRTVVFTGLYKNGAGPSLPLVVFPVICGALYEFYVFTLACQAHVARLKMTKINVE